MIGFLALLIAFLTLLSPSPEADSAPQSAPDASADAAIVAGPADPLDALVGTWRVQITPSENLADEVVARTDISLEIVERAARGSLAFGPPDERWQGDVTCSGRASAVEFASRARCSLLDHEVAHITGRLDGDRLLGTLFLEADEELVTWTAERTGRPANAR
ncbi:MAG: hypothetical protein AAGG01_10340 [Planctomycetota bacterium]